MNRVRFWLPPLLVILIWCGSGGVGGCSHDEHRAKALTTHDLIPALAAHTQFWNFCFPGRTECLRLLGEGWQDTEGERTTPGHCWTNRPRATLMLPVDRPGSGSLLVRGFGANDRRGRRTLQVVINGEELGPTTLPGKWSDLRFTVPAGVLRAGYNEVSLFTERLVRPSDFRDSFDVRQLGICVDHVRFLPDATREEPSLDDTPTWVPEIVLDAARTIPVPIAQLAGAELRLTWQPGEAAPEDLLCVMIRSALDDVTHHVTRIPAQGGDGRGCLVFPRDLPDMLLLTFSLEGPHGAPAGGKVILDSADLQWLFRPHNVVLIVVDTLRPDHLSCYGDRRGLSPNIDRLAADGILFTRARTHSPITGPSHAALFTSRYPSETGVLNNGTMSLAAGQPLLAEILKSRGYATGAAVSLPPLQQNIGFDRGFDRYNDRFGQWLMVTADSLLSRAQAILAELQEPFLFWAHFCDPHEPYNAHGLLERSAELWCAGKRLGNVPTSSHDIVRFDLELPAGEVEIHLRADHPFRMRKLGLQGTGGLRPRFVREDPFSEPTRDYAASIGAAGSRQACLVVGLSDQIPDLAEMQKRYALEVSHVDVRVGALLDTLRAKDLYDESFIVFTSDHGEALGEHGERGHIHTLYDPMLRVPLIIKPPRSANLPAGQRRDDPAALVDILPTILTQLDLPISRGGRGRNLLEKNATSVDAVIFCETHAPQARRTLYGLCGASYKIILATGEDEYELYDLMGDQGEIRDLYQADDPISRTWRQHLTDMLSTLARADTTVNTVQLDEEAERALRALGY